MKILDDILAAKTLEVRRLQTTTLPVFVKAGPRPIVVETLRRNAGEPLRLITEIKRRSPSAGPLSTVLSPGKRGIAYAHGGASMISVLCDKPFFDGSFDDLMDVRNALDGVGRVCPILAKEFVIDESQISCAVAHGADAILLIARIVTAERLRELARFALDHGIEPLVEVATQDELTHALATHATLIGVNARDLDTLVMDPVRAADVLAKIPDDRVAIYLSGLKDEDAVGRVAQTRAHAALIGEALMRQDDPVSLLGGMCIAAYPR